MVQKCIDIHRLYYNYVQVGDDGKTRAQRLNRDPTLSLHGTTSLAAIFRLLGDPTRLRILLFCLPGPRLVGDIAASLDLSQTLVSHDLRLLRSARLVKSERRSKQIFYEVADGHVSDMLIDMASHIEEEHLDD